MIYVPLVNTATQDHAGRCGRTYLMVMKYWPWECEMTRIYVSLDGATSGSALMISWERFEASPRSICCKSDSLAMTAIFVLYSCVSLRPLERESSFDQKAQVARSWDTHVFCWKFYTQDVGLQYLAPCKQWMFWTHWGQQQHCYQCWQPQALGGLGFVAPKLSGMYFV